MSFNIEVESGTSVRLPTAGKYCDRDIVITATGGGGDSGVGVSWKEVNFVDYDGSLLHSYSLEEAKSLTELPELPSRDGLTCQGWNYDLETIKSYDRPVTVGATYITDDGKTRIYIHLEEGRTSPMLGCCPNGTVTVDWGDGTATETLTGTSASVVKWTSNHNYASAGNYVITLTVDGAMGLVGNKSANGAYILRYASTKELRNIVYQNSVVRVEIGNGVTSIGGNAFQNCYNLASVVIPNGVTSIGENAFASCYCLSGVVIPSGVTSIGGNAFTTCSSLANVVIPSSVTSFGTSAFANCYALASVVIPNGVTSIGGNAFQNCYNLASVVIPNGVTSFGGNVFTGCYNLSSVVIQSGVTYIGMYAFQYCNALSNVVIPSSVTSIGASAFSNCYGLSSVVIQSGVISIGGSVFQNCCSLANVVIPSSVTSFGTSAFANCYGIKIYDFSSHTSVPSLQNTNAFSGIQIDCEIRVPAALYDTWIAATNWSTYASQIVAV